MSEGGHHSLTEMFFWALQARNLGWVGEGDAKGPERFLQVNSRILSRKLPTDPQFWAPLRENRCQIQLP